MSPRPQSEALRIDGRIVAITHPEKALFPNDGITKGELVVYYQRIAPMMLPYLRGRPIVMERYPDGINEQKIFQKNTPSYFPDWIRVVSLPKKDGVVRHVVCDDASTLVYLGNQAVITPHTWLSRVDKPNHPGQMIFDLDPSDGDFRAVCDAANVNLAQNEPQRLTTEVRKSKRQGRIFIDTERNAAPAYAVRPCDG